MFYVPYPPHYLVPSDALGDHYHKTGDHYQLNDPENSIYSMCRKIMKL